MFATYYQYWIYARHSSIIKVNISLMLLWKQGIMIFFEAAVTYCMNIGIKHDFLYINICQAPRPEPETNVLENHVWSLLLHKNILSFKISGGNASKYSFFPVPIMPRKGTLPANVLKANDNVTLTSRNYVCCYARFWCWHQILNHKSEVRVRY